MARTPPNTPGRGDRVKARGQGGERLGRLVKMNDATKWATIAWDDNGGPKMAHLHELERVSE